ncbi:hypothetical protein P691DRAFT_788889 [Macrolepiota fuliginosa MF-IS2]|uniref:Uncharacterized protein n=1 Tax=Macrolepiota fuliginosa MF-IS2 TaxID=1400762 RepID=A0A9P5X1F2_9AGAR|nr:hypothetical protein P691DRAFT_788889 [Macrolepiota fuliginosa MF-IS2]
MCPKQVYLEVFAHEILYIFLATIYDSPLAHPCKAIYRHLAPLINAKGAILALNLRHRPTNTGYLGYVDQTAPSWRHPRNDPAPPLPAPPDFGSLVLSFWNKGSSRCALTHTFQDTTLTMFGPGSFSSESGVFATQDSDLSDRHIIQDIPSMRSQVLQVSSSLWLQGSLKDLQTELCSMFDEPFSQLRCQLGTVSQDIQGLDNYLSDLQDGVAECSAIQASILKVLGELAVKSVLLIVTECIEGVSDTAKVIDKKVSIGQNQIASLKGDIEGRLSSKISNMEGSVGEGCYGVKEDISAFRMKWLQELEQDRAFSKSLANKVKDVQHKQAIYAEDIAKLIESVKDLEEGVNQQIAGIQGTCESLQQGVNDVLEQMQVGNSLSPGYESGLDVQLKELVYSLKHCTHLGRSAAVVSLKSFVDWFHPSMLSRGFTCKKGPIGGVGVVIVIIYVYCHWFSVADVDDEEHPFLYAFPEL